MSKIPLTASLPAGRLNLEEATNVNTFLDKADALRKKGSGSILAGLASLTTSLLRGFGKLSTALRRPPLPDSIPFMQDEKKHAAVAVVLVLMTVVFMAAGHIAEDHREAARLAAGINIAQIVGEGR